MNTGLAAALHTHNTATFRSQSYELLLCRLLQAACEQRGDQEIMDSYEHETLGFYTDIAYGIIRELKEPNQTYFELRHVARMGEGRGVYRVLVGRPEGKRPLGRPRRRWEDNITMDLTEIWIDGANWIQMS
jgi:hypothetical protein